MSTSSAIDSSSATSTGSSASCGEPQVAGEAVRAEARVHRVGRREQQRVRARAVAVGHDDGVARRRARAAEQAVELRGVEQRAVAGEAEDLRGAELARVGGAAQHRLVLAALGRVVERERVVALGDPLRGRVGADDEHAVDRLARAAAR